MGETQENFKQKLRSMRNLCCVVCSEWWYTDGECSDPALYVCVLRCTRYTRTVVSFFLLCKQALKPYPQNDLFQGHSGCTAVLVTCVTHVCLPTPHGLVLKCYFFGGGGGNRGERKTKRGNISFSKTKKQRDLNSLPESYETYLRSQCATVPVLDDAAHF